jgi:pyridinium-3,5-biscarboxylic acid mononucleotide sulfurtransferase
MTAITLDRKAERLRQILAECGRLLVAYSGGVDSAFLASVAHEVLGDQMLAVIADSASLARTHLEDALGFARENEIPVEVVETRELENPAYVRNDAMRCFHCKDELFTVLDRYREARGFDAVAYGVNADDTGDFRPGQQAARQHHVLAPLLEAGLNKTEIRELARKAGLRVWDKPASACLSSRMEYGREVTPETLSVIERGEDALRVLGFRQFRVRHHGDIVRIEISRDELSRALTAEMAGKFTTVFKRLGFKFVTLDLEGFRSGSMNQLLTTEELLRGAAQKSIESSPANQRAVARAGPGSVR